MVDLGAGDGAITKSLVDAGARVIAVELDAGRAEGLRRGFATDDVRVVRADLQRFRYPGGPFRVVANPPYALTREVVRSVLRQSGRLRSADLVLPRRLVNQLIDRPPRAGRWWLDVSLSRGPTIPARAFVPRPRVDSAVLQVRRR